MTGTHLTICAATLARPANPENPERRRIPPLSGRLIYRRWVAALSPSITRVIHHVLTNYANGRGNF